MRFFRAKYGAGILTGLMAAAVVCLAIGGYQAYSQTLQAQQELTGVWIRWRNSITVMIRWPGMYFCAGIRQNIWTNPCTG